MSGTPCDLYIECLIGSSLGDNDSSLKGVIENDAIRELPGRGVEGSRSSCTYLFLHCKDNDKRWMWQLLLHKAGEYFKNDSDASSIIGSKVGCTVTVEDAIAQHRLMPSTGGNMVQVGIEQEGFSFAREGSNQVTY